MNRLQDMYEYSGIKPCLLNIKQSNEPDSLKQLKPINVLHQEVNVVVVLEGPDVGDYEGGR